MDSNKKTKFVKIGFEISEDLDSQIERARQVLGLKDRAEFIRGAILKEIDRIETDLGYKVRRLPEKKKE
jgi:metal-responsive CopG/Arc/MetJ family transcriptional regulator